MPANADNLIGFANKVQHWARDRPLLVDAGYAVLAVIIELIDLIATNDDTARSPNALAFVILTLGSAALVRRRRNPTGTLIAVGALMVPFYLLDYGSFLSFVGLSAFYAVAAHATNRRRAWATLLVIAPGLCILAAFTLLDRPDGFVYSGLASMSTTICLSILVGVIARNHEQIFVKAEARADRAEADRASAAQRAATQERLRIARELHDVVAHGMSVISVQAAAAQEIARSDPDQAIALMKTVETTGRESLNEMRRMLGVLRNGDTAGEGQRDVLSPQPSLNDIEGVITHCRDAGLPTEFDILGEPRPLSAGLELTIFRIVQEALTNVLKHGGIAAEATVELSYRYATVMVRVSDTGRGLAATANSATTGNGLLGMRERVELYDGQLTAGAKPGGGYQVTAVLPFSNTDRPRVVSAEAEKTGQPL